MPKQQERSRQIMYPLLLTEAATPKGMGVDFGLKKSIIKFYFRPR